ncbi:MAG TPA: EamA family transporter [Burkholderiaceae bacterium]
MNTVLAPRHLLLGLAVVAVWGSNFVVIKFGLQDLPPLLFAALRFSLAAVPAVFLLRRPAVPWRNLAAYGVLIGAGQFGLLFMAMRADITPGLASLVIQIQVFFTVGLAMLLSGDRPQPFQWLATAIAAAGIATIAWHSDGSATPLGLMMIGCAALSWAGGNLVGRAAGQVDMLAYMAWSSLFAVPPLALLSLLVEGWPRIAAGLAHAGWETWAAVLWQSAGNTLFGYGAWAWLLSRYAAASVTPLALLVPVFGMGASALWLAEPLQGWKLGAAALVMAGLAVNVLWPRWRARQA